VDEKQHDNFEQDIKGFTKIIARCEQGVRYGPLVANLMLRNSTRQRRTEISAWAKEQQMSDEEFATQKYRQNTDEQCSEQGTNSRTINRISDFGRPFKSRGSFRLDLRALQKGRGWRLDKPENTPVLYRRDGKLR